MDILNCVHCERRQEYEEKNIGDSILDVSTGDDGVFGRKETYRE